MKAEKAKLIKIKKNLEKIDHSLVSLFHILADYSRFHIFWLVVNFKDLCVSQIAEVSNITVSAASQHLRMMEMAGLVERVKKGQRTCFKINEKNILVKDIIKILKIAKSRN